MLSSLLIPCFKEAPFSCFRKQLRTVRISSSFSTELGLLKAFKKGVSMESVGELGGQASEALGGSYAGSFDGFLCSGLST